MLHEIVEAESIDSTAILARRGCSKSVLQHDYIKMSKIPGEIRSYEMINYHCVKYGCRSNALDPKRKKKNQKSYFNNMSKLITALENL